MIKIYKLKFLLMVLLIGHGVLSVAQKPNYTFTFKVYINEATAQYYGGHAAIQDSITSQFDRVNQYYNSESRFNGTYSFVPSAFSYYSETGANADVMNSIFNSSQETSYDYRVIYSRDPYDDNDSSIHIRSDYNPNTLSVRFSLNAEAEWQQTLFGATPTKILCHELGHSRGAFDMYSVNVDAANNQVYNDVSFNYDDEKPSIMNYLYNPDANWDDYSIYCINNTAGNILTTTTWGNLFWSMFPDNFSIRAKDQNGNPVANAMITLYGVKWLSDSIYSSDAFVYYTDSQGLVTFDGTNISTNPFHRTGTEINSDFANFMVVANLGSQGYFNWMPVFDVQSAKVVDGQTDYYLDFTFDVSACTDPQYVAGTTYATGSMVTNNGHTYECTVGGWCSSSSAYYYAPGTGTAWETAWNDLGACGSSNQSPSVSLTAPSDNATYTAPASVTISADASDSDGSVSKVEFYNGSSLLATVTSSPYSYTWSSVAAGSYTLTAKAYDNNNAVTTSSAVNITVSGGSCTAQQWSSSTAYTGGAVVQYLGIKYVANWWTQNESPDLHNGGSGSGQPWTSQGTCNSKAGYFSDVNGSSSITLAPNPADENVSVTVSLSIADEVTVEVYNVFGEKVASIYKGSLSAGEQELYFNIASYVQGTYILMLNGSQVKKSVRFVKK